MSEETDEEFFTSLGFVSGEEEMDLDAFAEAILKATDKVKPNTSAKAV